MTDLQAAAQQALEALESLQGGCTDSDDGTVEAITVWCPEVIDALRAALAQQPAASVELAQPEGEDWSLLLATQESLREHMAEIHRLRAEVDVLRYANDRWRKLRPAVPLFLLHCGQIDSGGEQDDWETEADSGQRVDEFARQYPGKTVPLYAHPPLARQRLVDEQIVRCSLMVDDPLLWGRMGDECGVALEQFARAIEAAHGIKG